MCGLVGVKRKDGKSAAKNVLKRYNAQKQRGMRGFGYVCVENDMITKYERSADEAEILAKLRLETAPEIWFHHRMPTSTPNIEEQAHPLLIEAPKILDHQYFVMHNGVIRNDDELHIEHEAKGFVYQTDMVEQIVLRNKKVYHTETKFNDSEALAIEVALVLDGKKDYINTEGAAAVMGLKTKGKKVVDRFFFRNSANPLLLYEDSVMTTLTSLGKGTEVKPSRVMRMLPDGSTEEINPIIITPTTWKQRHETTVYPRRTEHYNDNPAYGGGMSESDWDEFYSNGGRMGGQPRVRDLLGLPSAPRSPQDARDEDDEGLLVKKMTTGRLWIEFDDIIGKIEQAEHDIALLDEAAIEIGQQTPEDYIERQRLENKLDEHKDYFEAIDKEISVRASVEGGINRAV